LGRAARPYHITAGSHPGTVAAPKDAIRLLAQRRRRKFHHHAQVPSKAWPCPLRTAVDL
jgi:hypothetical protein